MSAAAYIIAFVFCAIMTILYLMAAGLGLGFGDEKAPAILLQNPDKPDSILAMLLSAILAGVIGVAITYVGIYYYKPTPPPPTTIIECPCP